MSTLAKDAGYFRTLRNSIAREKLRRIEAATTSVVLNSGGLVSNNLKIHNTLVMTFDRLNKKVK